MGIGQNRRREGGQENEQESKTHLTYSGIT